MKQYVHDTIHNDIVFNSINSLAQYLSKRPSTVVAMMDRWEVLCCRYKKRTRYYYVYILVSSIHTTTQLLLH